MAASQQNITANTLMGANLVAGGATFRVWAANALKVYVALGFSGDPAMEPADQSLLLVKNENGHWTGFIPGLKKGQLYMYFVVGTAGSSLKRDPQARALTPDDDSLNWRCILEDADFPWHDSAFVTPAFSDMVIYQLHVGSYYVPNYPASGTFLDVASKVPHLSALGITVIQLLPIHEWKSFTSEGYNGMDFYSPEQLYTVPDDKLQPYLSSLNGLLDQKQLSHYQLADIGGGPAQLRALIDLCHAYGIAVIFDLVFSNASGSDAHDFTYFDMQDPEPPFVNSPYLTTTGYIGQLFDYQKPEVCDFLINNAKLFLEEYHVDGFRYDEISNINGYGKQPYAWDFCQDLTATLKFIKPGAIQHAEYWQGEYWQDKHLVVMPPVQGLGFDTILSDSQRNAVHSLIGAASQANDDPLNMQDLANGLWEQGYQQEWQMVQGAENHDVTYYHTGGAIRMAKLSDPSNSRSWYATSRSRVAMGICLTGPGIPMMFMGQEFLEDKLWCDDQGQSQFLIYWDGLNTQKQMSDFLRFTRELIALRWQYPALRGQGFAVTHINNNGRVLAFHRWVPDAGQDILVVVSLSNTNTYGYRLGFPIGGAWKEAFNSDVYENWVNPAICGNGGWADADNQPYDGLGYSAAIALPANGILVFAK
jgi:1,4-alpha-glucan branching enzyme